jgi:hypothetical protein
MIREMENNEAEKIAKPTLKERVASLIDRNDMRCASGEIESKEHCRIEERIWRAAINMGLDPTEMWG